MTCNSTRELNIHELLRDVEEAFEEISTVLKRDYTPEAASLEVKAMLGAVETIFQDLGKTLQAARPGIHSRPGTVVAEVAEEFLKIGDELKAQAPEDDKKGKPTEEKPGNPVDDKKGKPEEENKEKAADDKKGKGADKKKGRPLKLAEQIDLLQLAEKTFLVQVRKLNKFVKDDADPGHIKIQKVIYEMLSKMRGLGHDYRPKRP